MANNKDMYDTIDDAALMELDLDTPTKQQRPQVLNPYSPARKKAKAEDSIFGSGSPFRVGNKVNYTEYVTQDAAASRIQESQPTDRIEKPEVIDVDNTSSPNPKSGTRLFTQPEVIDIDTPIKHSTVSPNQQNGAASSPNPQIRNPELEEKLRKTMDQYFGFSTFRQGQLSVFQSLLEEKRDCAVFWASGSGKSLCYQIPPLLLNKTAIVVSPLISLMQDQVNKLNAFSGDPIAAYLGSSQTDPLVEGNVLAGKYQLVYVTPEKLRGSDFLRQIASLGEKLALIAIDEAHCVSEWGHDFRKDYRGLGSAIRSCGELKGVPLLALTATASPRVREDIISNLHLNDPFISLHTFDRHNLEISVKRKPPSGGYIKALSPFLTELKGSAVIYAPTKTLVDEIHGYLDRQGISAAPYHAGLNNQDRTDAHYEFLTGKIKVIVATVAFGMGIDKPDIRHVFHWGAPKTVEEYYQQIGRAGRDGLPSSCIMWANDSDFSRYSSDFYTQHLTQEVIQSIEESTQALRKFAMNIDHCRRATILKYFKEYNFPFGERCGTCDNCKNYKHYGAKQDFERDFSQHGAKIVLTAVKYLREPPMSILEKVINANEVEEYRYTQHYGPAQVKALIQQQRNDMPKKRTASHFKELFPLLIEKGYLSHITKKTRGGSYERAYTAYKITPKGETALRNQNNPIILPIPLSIREEEAEEERKRLATIEQLKQSGIDTTSIPQDELEGKTSGEILQVCKHWLSYIENLRNTGRTERLDQMEDLKDRIDKWRLRSAAEYRMAPGSIMPDHLMLKVAYASASAAAPMESNALFAAGVRIGVSALAQVLNDWMQETSSTTAVSKEADAMKFTKEQDDPFRPAQPWQHAVYKPNKRTGFAAWEGSYDRFCDGEHPQSIAINPSTGNRPIQVNTVVGHILDALLLGRPVSLLRLSTASTPPPNREDWEQLSAAEKTLNMDVGRDHDIKMTELLSPIIGHIVNIPYAERNEEEKLIFGNWCYVAKWYLVLRRVGYQPKF